MAVKNFRAQNVIATLFLVLTIVNCSKLNVPRVLLPVFNDFSVKFTLEATEGGCYTWSTTRNDIIQIIPIDEDIELKCSVKATVTTVTKEAARNIAVVLAEDVYSKQMLRCDVIVDSIHSLLISTTTRELFMEEAPEDFEVKAFDDQGNEFSSLEDVQFDWNIVSLGPNKDTVLRYITFRDSPYETPQAIAPLENEGKKGYSILLEGIKSGSAKVSVRLPYPEYKHVVANEVQLMVVANLLITPAEVYAMPGDSVGFRIFYLNDGRMEEIPFPDTQYYLEAENANIGNANKKTGNVTALKEGKTRIVLRDRNVGKDDPLLKLPAANLIVVQPNYMILNVLPHKNWAVMIGDHHDIVAEVYDSADHRLYLGGAVEIVMELAPEFYTDYRAPNGSWVTGYGVKSTIVTVQATLTGVYSAKAGLNKLARPITAKGDLMIYNRITIFPSEIILPWDPVTRPKYDIDLFAKGGDGRFLWTSSDHTIGLVSQTGHVRTHSNGFFEVSAVMLRNHNNRCSAKFLILPPSRLEIVEFVMESELGSPVFLHIALYAEQEKDGVTIQLPFTKCQELPFHIKQSDAKFRHNKTAIANPVGISCGNIAMTALDVGTSKVTVTYYQDGRALEDSVTLSAFYPLTLVEPKHDVVLAVGTTINLVYIGGPRPVLGKTSDHQRVIVSENESIAKVKDISQFHSIPGEDFTIIEVLCRKLGETDIKLMISNTPAAANCQPQTSSITTRVTCGKPRKIVLQPELKIADLDACPMDLSSGSVVVHSVNNIDIDVAVFDDCGTRFLNISSFNLEWLLTPSDKGHLLSKNSIFPRNLTIGTVPVPFRSYQTLEPKILVGNLLINVTMGGYKLSDLKKYGVSPERPFFTSEEDKDKNLPPIKCSLALFLVEDTIIKPNVITIFNHPGNKQIVKVQQGSGYFEVALSADDLAAVKYTESSREIEITPLKSGELTIQVIDLCLVSKPATLLVTVVSVGIIRVDMVDKVEIGMCIPVIVRLYDENDNLMDIPHPKMIDLRPEFQNKIANIQTKELPKGHHGWGVGELHYTVSGVELGDTKLVFTVSGSDEDVNSAPMDLQVFQPIRIYPRNGTIVVGTVLQLLVKGGPQPNTNVVFKSANSKLVYVDDRGVVTAESLGVTKLTAQSIGIHPSTGHSVLYSVDTIEVKVVELQAIKIMSPISRFRVGAMVPFWCWGIPNISPVILGSLEPPIVFKWNVEDKLLVDLSGVFHPVGVFKRKTDRVSIKVTGLMAGRTRMFVNASVSGSTVNLPKVETVMLSASIEIEVFQEFTMLYPKDLTGRALMMAPFSEIQLATNMDPYPTKITYSLPGSQAPSTEVLADQSVSNSDVLVRVSPEGLIQSYGALGHALLILIATDEMGLKQRLSFVVEVKPIQYMSLIVIANWRIHSDSPLRVLPLGTEFQLRAHFYDNIGNKFHAGPKELKIKTSRCDLIKVWEDKEDATVWMATKKAGTTMVKAWADGIQNTADYVKITVEQTVRPILDHLTSGDIICMWTPVVSEFNTPGTWRSSDSSLITINPALDIGFVGNKEGVVVLTHSLLLSAPIHIQIYPVSEIEFLEDVSLVLTNGAKDSIVRVVLILQSEKSAGMKTNNLIQGWRCRTDVRKLVSPAGFKCFMEFSNKTSLTASDLFRLVNSWVPETGQYACKLINLGVSGSEIATLKTNLTVWATTEDGEVESPHMKIRFLPGVYVPPEVFLAENSNTGELIAIGLPEVLEQIEVESADTSIIYVDEGKMNDETSKIYQVQLIDYHWRLADMADAMGIIITSPITKQHLRVIVKVTGSPKQMCGGMGQSPVFVFLQNYKYAIAMAIAMLIIFFLTFYFYSNYMQPVVNVNVNPNRSMLLTSGIGPSGQGVNYAANMNRLSPNQSFGSQCPSSCSRFNCNCSSNQTTSTHLNCLANRSPGPSGCAANAAREPVYGDPSSFYNTSPEVRRNRRGM